MLLLATAHALPPESSDWAPLLADPVAIACTTSPSGPYCRATGVIATQLATASATFGELDRHVARMGAISTIARLERDVLHVVMDYPFPLSDRDYVARFVHRTEPDGTEVYAWAPVEHPSAPPTEGVVRLAWLDGEWRFAAEGASTRVTYVWQADPGGRLPDVNAVRTKAGTLAVLDMANACGTRIVSP